MTDYDERLMAASDARAEVYRALGEMGEDVLAPIINPMLIGGPTWPGRPAWRVIRRPDGRTLIASDGLSNPWEDPGEPQNGFGLEVFMETADQVLDHDASIPSVAGSWLFAAVREISNTVAGHGGVRALIEELGSVSVEVAGAPFPEGLRNEHGRVGVLLNVPADLPASMDLPGGNVLLVPITVITLDELQHIVRGGDPARAALIEKLPGATSDLGRESVLG